MTTPALIALVRIDQQAIAELFVSYLKSLSIVAEVQPQEGSYLVFVESSQHQQAQIIFAEFSRQPYHPKYQEAAWQNDSTEYVGAKGLKSSILSKFFDHAGLITLVIFATCWLVFISALLGWQQLTYGALSFYQQLSLSAFLEQPIKLIGPALIHFSWLHIVFNTMWWWQLGGDIEKSFGKGTLLTVFLVSAIVSNVGQYLVSGPNFGGLSGVVYAVVGFVWLSGIIAPHKGIGLSKNIFGFLLFWLLLGYVDLLPINMANTAHLLGLISGCLLAVFEGKIKRVNQQV